MKANINSYSLKCLFDKTKKYQTTRGDYLQESAVIYHGTEGVGFFINLRNSKHPSIGNFQLLYELLFIDWSLHIWNATIQTSDGVGGND